jgi:hypothetical protein
MARMVAVLVRLAVCTLAYALAAVAAAFVLMVGVLDSEATRTMWAESPTFGVQMAALLALAVATLAFPPAALVMLATEVLGLRALALHLFAGALIGGGTAWMQGGDLADRTAQLTGFTSAGIVAALLYWCVAGRQAGAGLRSDPDARDVADPMARTQGGRSGNG